MVTSLNPQNLPRTSQWNNFEIISSIVSDADMPPGIPLRPLLLVLFLSLVSSYELQLLLTIKNSFKNSNTKVFDSWDSSNPKCNFTGIICDPITNLVKEINLSNQSLVGSVPFHAICQLKSVEKISFGFNSLHGNVSQDLNNCVKLEYLDLRFNQFSGSFPDISSLSQLGFLYLNFSGISGDFPWNSFDNMTNLSVLSVAYNNFTPTAFPNVILKLSSLTWLHLSNCSFFGKIPPGIGNLTSLVNLELAKNNLYGEIPVEITKLKSLKQLELYGNQLTGKLPVGLRNLTNLEYFDASKNSLTGDLTEVRFLNQLKSLQLFENDFTGQLPPELGEFKQLENLSVYRNRLRGQIPQTLGSWSNFDFIDASENFFSGPIPPDMCKRGAMTELLLLQNNLTGEIPATYANCLTLTRFRVSNNLLSGVVPRGIWGLPNVVLIDLEMNGFEGPITSDIRNAVSLERLLAADNRLYGELPREISNATNLLVIQLSNNQFSGGIPATIGVLRKLGNLNLQNNKFSGPIPESLGHCVSLNEINLAYNLLTDTIPASLGSLPFLTALNLSDNQLSGRIPGSLSSLKLSLLDFSNNKLTGPIPESLTHEAYKGSFSGNSGLCSQSIKPFRRCSSVPKPIGELRSLLISFMVLGITAMFVSIICYLDIKKKSEMYSIRSWKEGSWDVKSFHRLSFTEDEILDAIRRDNLIGKGGSGSVYRVLLENGKELAVKHIWNTGSDGKRSRGSASPILAKRGRKSPEFDAEVETLSSIRHVNVVKLYCSITSEDSNLLVYEYMPNGSLWDRLHMSEELVLDWETRYEIALGAARGLEYLHHGCDRPIIHRDVKSSNILLDECLKPRIADFGLAKIVQSNSSKDSTQIIAGTHGYIAPEYGYTNKINEKCDVYSFGVVLMELVTGKKPIEPEFGENKDIVEWISSKLKAKESVLSIVDSVILDADREVATIRVLKIAILCTAQLPTLRPTMRSVVQMLEDACPCKLVDVIITKDDTMLRKKEEFEKLELSLSVQK